VVLISSRLGLVCVPAASLEGKPRHQQQARFLRTYARKLPSSLTRDHSSTLACSASLPVSVCGTVEARLHVRPFSPVQVLPTRGGGCPPHSYSPLRVSPYQLERRSSRRATYPPGLRISQTILPGTGISTRCPSASARAYALGPTNPPRIIRAAEPSGLRWGGFAPPLYVTHPGIRTRGTSTGASAPASMMPRRSPTTRARRRSSHPQRRC
jgi:hypothetical protein